MIKLSLGRNSNTHQNYVRIVHAPAKPDARWQSNWFNPIPGTEPEVLFMPRCAVCVEIIKILKQANSTSIGTQFWPIIADRKKINNKYNSIRC